MLPKLGFSLELEYDRPMEQVIGLLKDAGLSAVSPVWGQALSSVAACAEAQDMTIQSLHAPAKGMALLWQPDPLLSADLQRAMLDSVEACARFQIPVLVVHGWQGHGYTFYEDNLYFQNFDELVTRAQALGVSIAFENLEGEEYLAVLMERYRGLSHIGFCWDSGHDRCYPHTIDFLQAFGHRLMMTHINDNFGVRTGVYTSKDDLHLLPFDGNSDWDLQLGRLRCAKRQDTLNFELKTLSHGTATYPHWKLEQFIAEAGSRARMIAEKYAAQDPAL